MAVNLDNFRNAYGSSLGKPWAWWGMEQPKRPKAENYPKKAGCLQWPGKRGGVSLSTRKPTKIILQGARGGEAMVHGVPSPAGGSGAASFPSKPPSRGFRSTFRWRKHSLQSVSCHRTLWPSRECISWKGKAQPALSERHRRTIQEKLPWR